MKRLLFLMCLVLISCCAVAQAGYQILVTIKPVKNQLVYLGYYYGKLKALADSSMLNNNGTAIFSGKQKLPGGIYFLVSARKEILFELLLDKQQHFSVTADTAHLPNSIQFTGSEDNSMFQIYSKQIATDGTGINNLLKELHTAGSKADSNRISEKIQLLNKQMQEYRNELAKKYPASLLAALFRSMKEPIVPSAEKHPGQKYDSLFAYNYYKQHYWDGFSFTDDRLLRTPIFEPRLEKYYKELVVPDPDSIKKEIDVMLLKSKSNKEMYKYLLTNFVQKYINPEFMGQDAVFVHLFEKYINNIPEVDWFTEKYKKYMFERAYSLMANLIGQPASNLEMTDTSGVSMPLYGIEAPYTVICFWDPTCSHCKEMVPRLDSMFQNKWKARGVKVYGVMVDGGKEAWLQYIRENNLKDWIHVYETADQREIITAAGKPSYKQLYDVYQTPVLYLLDKEKRIIAKKLTYQQIDEVIMLKMKKI
ncbi:MAG: thioredoxin-like domain-containing protein [Chitinophagaceae bacterium]